MGRGYRLIFFTFKGGCHLVAAIFLSVFFFLFVKFPENLSTNFNEMFSIC